MAPTHRNSTNPRPHSPLRMSNPNTSGICIANRHRQQSNTAISASQLKVVHIGKNKQPVTIVKMVSINEQAWKKSACFESLRNTVYSLVDAHSVAEITALVTNELPLDTGSCFQASQFAAKSVLEDMLKIGFLEPLAFMNSTGKVVQIDDPNDIMKRPEDITFLRLRCTTDGES